MNAHREDTPGPLASEHVPPTRAPGADARPGALHAAAALQIHTRQAQRLIAGRRAGRGKPAIIGLLGFATLLRPIWAGARADDPYAHWWLARVHQHIESGQQWLASEQAVLDGALASMAAVEIGIAAVAEPVRVPLAFANPYGFRGAYLLAAYDRWICTALTLAHVGLRTSDETHRLLHRGGRTLRRAYASPLGYHALGITGEDVRAGTAKAERAKTLMGALPEDVLSGDTRAPYAPRLDAALAPPTVDSPIPASPIPPPDAPLPLD